MTNTMVNKWRYNFFCAVFLMIILGCNNSDRHLLLTDSLSLINHQKEIAQDTNRILHVYDSSYRYISNLQRGFIDTVSIMNELYRVRILKEDSDSCIIEKKEDQKWVFKFYVESSQYQTEKMFADVNLDGYQDLVVASKFYNDVYLFDPEIKKFPKKASFGIAKNVITLDSVHKIFCSIQFEKKLQGESLYNLQGRKPYVYYTYEVIYYPSINDRSDSIKAVKLYKCKTGNPAKRIFIKNLNSEKDVDIEGLFWRNNFQRLLQEY